MIQALPIFGFLAFCDLHFAVIWEGTFFTPSMLLHLHNFFISWRTLHLLHYISNFNINRTLAWIAKGSLSNIYTCTLTASCCVVWTALEAHSLA